MDDKEIIIDQEFWNDFILEAFEHIEDIETNVLTLEQNPDDTDIIHTMFRAFHTIKGLSGFVEHSIIQEIAHKTETLMDFCRKGEMKVDTKIVDSILKSADYIRRLCEDADSCRDKEFRAQIEKHIGVLEALANAQGAEAEKAKPEEKTEEKDSLIEPSQESKEEGINLLKELSFEEKQNETIEPEEEIKTEEIIETPPVIDIEALKKKFQQAEEAEIKEEKESKSEAKGKKKEDKKEELKKEEPKEEPVTEPIKPIEQAVLEKNEDRREGDRREGDRREGDRRAMPAAGMEEYMKVANSKIDHLVDMIGELIINQSLIEQYVALNYSHDNQLSTNMSGFLRITRELQGLSMSLRMVSLKPTFQKITRIARDTIQELHKDVEFVTSGEGTEIDRVVTDKLLDPLVHMIKNAISHGIETNPEDRVKQGKSKRARVELNAYNKRGKIFIEVKDDGRGIDTEVVYKKALEKGIINPNDTYTEDEIKEFIMLPGFSTAAVVDNISGRGVGMDVVRTQILKIGGKVDIKSKLHEGSTFTLEVPVNHAIMNGTVIEIKGEQFIIPTINVKEFLQPTEDQWIFTQQKRTMLKVRDHIIPIIPHSLYFKNSNINDNFPLVMLLEMDQELKALPIDNVINRQEVVVKPVGEEFSHLKFISGMSILGTGRVSLILDIDYLFKKEVKE